jgi:hypothetical protein
MSEELVRSFPLPDQLELACRYIKSELESAGIEVQRISIDDTITTDKEVPEGIRSRICEYAADKGITVTFLTSE